MGVHPKRQAARRGRPPAVLGADGAARARAGVGLADVRTASGTRRVGPRGRGHCTRSRFGGCCGASSSAPAWARLAVLERVSGATTGLLTERTVKRIRHVEVAIPGELVSLDTFYVGKLKGVGKVWQITECDVASSFAWAQVDRG